MIVIRREETGDVDAVRAVTEEAFGQPDEARIIDRLRAKCDRVLSLVGTRDGRVVGHILFSPVTINSSGRAIEGMGLGPMAVLPENQREGIGSALVEHGLAILRRQTCPFVVVLGHPEYYPRCGFERASKYGIGCRWPGVPDAAFMVLRMDKAVMKGVSGVALYRDEFDDVE